MDDATATIDGMTISTNAETQEALDTNFAPAPEVEKPADPPVDAAKPPVADKKPRHDPRARVEEATGQAAQAKRERDEARAEASSLKARLDALEQAARAPKTEPVAAAKPEAKDAEWKRFRTHPDAPKFGDFKGDEAFEDWNAAFAMFVADQRYDERRESEHRQAQQQRAIETEHVAKTHFAERIGADQPGFDEFVSSLDPRISGAVPVSDPRYAGSVRMSAISTEIAAGRLPQGYKPTFGNFLSEQIFRSPAPKELALHFTAHPEDVQRLSTLHPMQVIREMGKLEATLTQAAASLTTGTAPAPPMSKARPPIQPVKGSSQSPAFEDESDEMPVEEFIRRGNARDSKRRMA